MEYLLLEVRHADAGWFEENLSSYPISGLMIENDQDPSYQDNDWHWDETLVPPAQENVRIKVYASDAVLAQIKSELAGRYLNARLETDVEVDWVAKWAEEFRGFAVGDKLYVQPVHDAPHPERINLVIQAGMAFGTGTHETTMGCLEALERYLQPGDRVLDIGSGSGILSIAAIKLGAEQVVAVEIDEKALSNAAENRRLNEVEHVIEQRRGDLAKQIETPADLLVANILPEVLIRLYPDALRLLSQGKYLILSGILNCRVDELRAIYEPDFRLLEQIVKNDWSTLVYQKEAK